MEFFVKLKHYILVCFWALCALSFFAFFIAEDHFPPSNIKIYTPIVNDGYYYSLNHAYRLTKYNELYKNGFVEYTLKDASMLKLKQHKDSYEDFVCTHSVLTWRVINIFDLDPHCPWDEKRQEWK